MRAFDVYLNGKKLCRAGIGDHGVLSTIVNWVTRRDRGDLFLEIGGLVSPADELVSWINQKPLHLGDRILVKVVEASSVDRPTRRHRRDPAEQLKDQKRYVRKMVKQFGWKITSGSKPRVR